MAEPMMDTLQFDHLSIPTKEHRAGEVRDLDPCGCIGGGKENPYGIRWCRYDEGTLLPERICSVPHVAFSVARLENWLRIFPILVEPSMDANGVRSAFVEDNGIPIRLMESLDLANLGGSATSRSSALRYNSCWIPASAPRGDGKEIHLPDLKMFVTPHFDSPFRAGWVRYQEDAPYPAIVSRVPHLAFEVDDISAATKGNRVIIPLNSPTRGLLVAFIEVDGAPIELLQIDRKVLPDGV